MMGDRVVSLTDERKKREPHLQGRALCLACEHRWEVVVPVGVLWMECPSCHLERGRMVAQVRREGMHWHCFCGNDLFFVTPSGYYCPNCGVWAKGF